MKGNKKLLIVAVLLLLVAVSYTTYAIYKSSQAATAEVRTAKWNIEFTDGENEITDSTNIALTCAGNAHTATGVIAPGSNCTGTLVIDANDTEVDVAYTVTNGVPTLGGTPLSGDENDWTVTISPENGTIGYSAAERTATVTVTLAWAGVDDSPVATGATGDVINNADTELQNQSITVPLTLTAKQVVGN